MRLKWHLLGAGKIFAGNGNLSANGTKSWYEEKDKTYHVISPDGFIYQTHVESDWERVNVMLFSVLTGILWSSSNEIGEIFIPLEMTRHRSGSH